ncbi:MAG TPA: hypothetical protein VK901_13665 [Nitrospiraceae bacterium]|nr:hypothetical protein [Nitrospiraceae bacterium]
MRNWRTKGNGTAARVGYTVTGLMECRHRLLVEINVETFRGPTSETEGGRGLLEPSIGSTAGGSRQWGRSRDYVAKTFLAALFRWHITPHIAAKVIGCVAVHQRVGWDGWAGPWYINARSGRAKRSKSGGEKRTVGMGSAAFGIVGPEGQRRACLMGWLLNVKRLATLVPAPASR